MAIENSTLPARLLPDPTAVGDSLYEYLDGIGRPVVRALQHVRAINASASDAALVGIAPAPRCADDPDRLPEDNTPIELTDTHCRNDTTTSSPNCDADRHGAAMLEGNILTPQGWILGRLHIQDGRIQRIEGEPCDPAGNADPYLLPGFIDLHGTAAAAATSWKVATPSPPSPAPTGASARPRCWPPP